MVAGDTPRRDRLHAVALLQRLQRHPRLDGLPERFPPYEALLPLADGSVWVKTHDWRARDDKLHLVNADGMWIQRLTIPPARRSFDAGQDWVLLRQRGELDEHIVAVYQWSPTRL